MEQRTQTPTQPPTPVTDDAQATAPELLARATADYIDAQDRRDDLSHEDRVHGHEIGAH